MLITNVGICKWGKSRTYPNCRRWSSMIWDMSFMLRSTNLLNDVSDSLVEILASATIVSTAWATWGLFRLRTHAWNKQTSDRRYPKHCLLGSFKRKVIVKRVNTWHMLGTSKQLLQRWRLHDLQYGKLKQLAHSPPFFIRIPQFSHCSLPIWRVIMVSATICT